MDILKHENNKKIKIKCVIWDLDNTIWTGVLLEDQSVKLRPEVVNIIKKLDERGILQSIASRNEEKMAFAKLQEFGILDYFIYPQINWNSKARSIDKIIKSINIGKDTVAFIDDQIFEREDVSYSFPEVLCIDANEIDDLLDREEMNPRFITEDSKKRRLMYLSDITRNKVEEDFDGPKEEFLASLNMKLTISDLQQEDLRRAEELTIRTHQLNTTGYTYSYEEIDELRKSDKHKLLIVSLEDKYGDYGKIGLVIIELQDSKWVIKLLLMSCRVMSRGVGTIIIKHIINLAQKNKGRLLAEFVPNDRNRMMYVTYKFNGFKEISETDKLVVFENNLEHAQPFPDYMEVKVIEK